MLTRQLHDYARAVYYGAGRNPLRVPWVAAQLVRAKLKYRIGPYHFSLFGLAQVPARDWKDYIIMRPSFDSRRNALSPNAVRGVIDNKILFYEHCVRTGLPTIPIICAVGLDTVSTSSAVEDVHNAERLGVLLENAPPEMFAKPVCGAHGDGVFRVVRSGDSFEVDGRMGALEHLFDRLRQSGAGGGGSILQPQVRPHSGMRQWSSPNGLPTIRLVTVMRPAGPEIMYACLRIPVGASVTDNFGTGTNGNLVAGIDVERGVLTHAYGSRQRNWPVMVEVAEHPDTRCRFAGIPVPSWPEAVDAAMRGQASLPRLKTIGWDVAVTTNGVLLVELNSNYGVYTLQVAYQRGLKTELAAELGICIE